MGTLTIHQMAESSDEEMDANVIKEKAEAQKAKGNEALKAKNFKKAVQHYSLAINLDDNHVYYSNRSAAYASLEEWKKALTDAQHCFTVKEDWPKGYTRRAAAFWGLKMYNSAAEDYAKANEIESTAATTASLQKAIAAAEQSGNTLEAEREWFKNAQKADDQAELAKAGCVVC